VLLFGRLSALSGPPGAAASGSPASPVIYYKLIINLRRISAIPIVKAAN